jgi:hypothetical protein
MDQTQAITLGLGGTLDIGEDSGTPVDEEYTPPNRLAVDVQQVTIEPKPAPRTGRPVWKSKRA